MSLSDDALRRALQDRARSADMDAIDLAQLAETIAARGHGRPARLPATAWFGLAAAVIVIAVGGAGLVARLGSSVQSPAPSAVTTAAASAIPSPLPSDAATPNPSLLVTGCDAMNFSPSRCDAIVARARSQAGHPLDVATVIVHRPSGGDTSLGSIAIAEVDLVHRDGTTDSVEIRCLMLLGPRSSDKVCSADPQIWIAGGVSRDIVCGPVPGDETSPCAPLPPDPKPATIRASRPLTVATLDVPLDHVGHYEVLVGTATIPDGAITERAATLANPRPTDFWIDPYIELQVRPDRGGPPLDTYYARRVKGPEPVHVYLVFDVTELTAPSAVLQVRDLVVR